MKVTVGADGQLESIAVQQPSGYRNLDIATVAGFALCRFKPEMREGQAVRASFDAVFEWKIE